MRRSETEKNEIGAEIPKACQLLQKVHANTWQWDIIKSYFHETKTKRTRRTTPWQRRFSSWRTIRIFPSFCSLYLEKEGYTVNIAADGGKGVELFRQA